MKFIGTRPRQRLLKGSLLGLLLLSVLNLISGCGWIIFLDKGYHGTVIDADTKEPIQGAVVVAVYSAGCLRPVEGYSKTLGARETLTDVNGAFHTPLFLTASSPHCFRSFTDFIVFKAGYGYSPIPYLFSFPGSIPLDRPYDYYDFYSLTDIEDLFRKGVVVELPGLKTAEERRGAVPDIDRDFEMDVPELVKATEAETEYLKTHPVPRVIVRQESSLLTPP